MKVAAYQAPLLPAGFLQQALRLIRRHVAWCESAGVEILCCPEAVLGGLADYATDPAAIALDAERQLGEVLEPLASDRVTTIVGFTEKDRGRLYNAAAVWHKGSVVGLYRKLHPAIAVATITPCFEHRRGSPTGDRNVREDAVGLTLRPLIARSLQAAGTA